MELLKKLGNFGKGTVQRTAQRAKNAWGRRSIRRNKQKKNNTQSRKNNFKRFTQDLT